MQNYIIPQTVLAQLRGSYFCSIVIPLRSRIAGGQPKYLSLKYLSPAADSLCSRIAGGQPKYLSLKYLSPAADSLCSRIAGGQPKYLSLLHISGCLLPIADSPLPDCLLPIAHCRSPMPYNLLPTVLLYCSCICS